MSEKRLIDLEVKFTHMEDLVEQLNQIVTSQQLILDKLQKDVTDLKVMNSGSVNQSERNLATEVPPHY